MATSGSDLNTSWWAQNEALGATAKSYVGQEVTVTATGVTGVVERAYVRNGIILIHTAAWGTTSELATVDV